MGFNHVPLFFNILRLKKPKCFSFCVILAFV